MRTIKITGLLIAATATLTAGIAPAVARPNDHGRNDRHRPHKVCHIERHHGHAQRVCRIVR